MLICTLCTYIEYCIMYTCTCILNIARNIIENTYITLCIHVHVYYYTLLLYCRRVLLTVPILHYVYMYIYMYIINIIIIL